MPFLMAHAWKPRLALRGEQDTVGGVQLADHLARHLERLRAVLIDLPQRDRD
jgi:hypothetical protein